MVAAGTMTDLLTVTQLSLESQYWSRAMVDNMKIGGSLYFTSGGIALMFYKTPIVMAMNKTLAEDYKIPNIYETVLEGKWTVDLLYSYIKDAARDLDSNGSYDENDFYGLVVDGTFGGALFNTSGVKQSENDKILLGEANAVDVVQNLVSKFGSRDIVHNDPDGTDTSLGIFRDGRALFVDYEMNGVMSFRDLEFDYAIIPTPKYSENQDTYYTTCNTWLSPGVGIPITNAELDKTGLIMEVMAYCSDEYVAPAVYETTLDGKVARDDESSQMLDIIYENAYFDLVTAFNFGGLAVYLRSCVLGELENYVSGYASVAAKAQFELDAIVNLER